MAEMFVDDIALVATASAIREKMGSVDPIQWVAEKGFASAVQKLAAAPVDCSKPDIGIDASGKVFVSVPPSFGTFKQMLVFYVGWDCDATLWADRVAAGKLYPEVNGDSGYKVYKDMNKLPTLTTEGEYILYLYYTDVAGTSKSIENSITLGREIPSSVVALTSGTCTSASAVDGVISIEHGMDVTPNFCFMFTKDSPVDFSKYTGYLIWQMLLGKTITDNNDQGEFYCRTGDATARGALGESLYVCGMDATTVRFLSDSGHTLKSGVTYRWIAAYIKGI